MKQILKICGGVSMEKSQYKIGDIVTTTKQFGNIFGHIIPEGEPVKIVDITKEGYSIRDWRGITISCCGWNNFKQTN